MHTDSFLESREPTVERLLKLDETNPLFGFRKVEINWFNRNTYLKSSS